MWNFNKKESPAKHAAYIAGFITLGWLMAYTMFSFVEYLYFNALLDNFEANNLGLDWSQWWIIHYVALIVISVIGITVGLWQGNYWWRIVYVERKAGRK